MKLTWFCWPSGNDLKKRNINNRNNHVFELKPKQNPTTKILHWIISCLKNILSWYFLFSISLVDTCFERMFSGFIFLLNHSILFPSLTCSFIYKFVFHKLYIWIAWVWWNKIQFSFESKHLPSCFLGEGYNECYKFKKVVWDWGCTSVNGVLTCIKPWIPLQHCMVHKPAIPEFEKHRQEVKVILGEYILG